MADTPFEEWIRKTLFLQRVLDSDFSEPLRHLYTSAELWTPASVVLLYDHCWRKDDATIAYYFQTVTDYSIMQIIIAEVLRERGLMRYTEIAGANGFRLHRGQTFASPSGEIVAMEFHRKDPPNAPAPQ